MVEQPPTTNLTSTLPAIEFGTDGIRGVAGIFPLDVSTVQHVGTCLGIWLHTQRHAAQQNAASAAPRIVIGRDTRISGDFLLHSLAAGLLATGVHVIDAGIMTTPGIAHLVRSEAADLGIVVSASHNPYEQNGIKIFGADGFKLPDEAEAALTALINGPRLSQSIQPIAQPDYPFGKYSLLNDNTDPRSDYERRLQAEFAEQGLGAIKIVLDCAHGAASTIAPRLFRALAGTPDQVIVMHAAPDGLNINVAAGSESIRRDRAGMVATMREHHADLGIAFDGDADRVVFVTPEGMLIDGDHILGILGVAFQTAGKLAGASVVATDMSNSGLAHYLEQHGIALSRTKVGDRYVMQRLREQHLVLGGEQAGHVIILDADHTCGDGIYVGLLVAALVARAKREGGPSLQTLAAQIPRYPQVIASAHLTSRVDLKQVAGLAQLEAEALASFDGKGRINMRFSGTEPNLLRVMVEGGPTTTTAEAVAIAQRLIAPVAVATGSHAPHVDLVDCATGAPIA